MVSKSAVILGLVISGSLALQHPLLELSGAVVQIYKNPQDSRPEDLLEAAKDYLYQLVKLKMLVRINQPDSLQTLREVYLEGNPPFHLRNIPWEKFIETFKWDATHISTYQDLIDSTRKVWGECLEELEKRKEPDEII
ncbi:hypothetical protein J6590_058658 [Homalodisca vitripennis]|nr:hypothetical protein J6590_058658 [Homalodisca vitripennis]